MRQRESSLRGCKWDENQVRRFDWEDGRDGFTLPAQGRVFGRTNGREEVETGQGSFEHQYGTKQHTSQTYQAKTCLISVSSARVLWDTAHQSRKEHLDKPRTPQNSYISPPSIVQAQHRPRLLFHQLHPPLTSSFPYSSRTGPGLPNIMTTRNSNLLNNQFAKGAQANAKATDNPPTHAYRNVVPPAK